MLGRTGAVGALILRIYGEEVQARQKETFAVSARPLQITQRETQFIFGGVPVEVPFGMTSREAHFKAKIERAKALIYLLVYVRYHRTVKAAAAYREYCLGIRKTYDGPSADKLRQDHEDAIKRAMNRLPYIISNIVKREVLLKALRRRRLNENNPDAQLSTPIPTMDSIRAAFNFFKRKEYEKNNHTFGYCRKRELAPCMDLSLIHI